MPHTTVAIPHHSRARLDMLAKLDGKNAGNKLAELIDAACLAAGLEVASDAVRVTPRNAGFLVDLFGGTYRAELPRAGIAALASALKKVADEGGGMLDLDHSFDVMRQGAGVVLKIDAIARKEGQLSGETIKLKKSMAPEVAREIARGLLAGLPAEAAA